MPTTQKYQRPTSEPKLSVVIPAYNAEHTIERCLRSISSSHRSYEVQVVVVDDGSVDDTFQTASAALSALHFHISSSLFSQANAGAPTARNRGLEECGGKRVIFLDSDDFYLDGFVDFILDNIDDENDVIAGNYCFFQGGEPGRSELRKDLQVSSAILRGRFTVTGAIVVKTEVAREHLWNTRLTADQDGEWTGRMLISGKSISFHPEISLAYSTENTNSISRKASPNSIKSRALVCDILLESVILSNSIPENTKNTYRVLLAQRLDSIAFGQFHVAPTFCQKLHRRARDISPSYTPCYNGKSGVLRRLLGFHLASMILMLGRR